MLSESLHPVFNKDERALNERNHSSGVVKSWKSTSSTGSKLARPVAYKDFPEEGRIAEKANHIVHWWKYVLSPRRVGSFRCRISLDYWYVCPKSPSKLSQALCSLPFASSLISGSFPLKKTPRLHFGIILD